VRSLLLLMLLVAPASAAPPRIVVTIVVDQFAGWLAAERLPLLPASGGFARLRREGTWVRALVYDHAVTDTAPGHAALFTGAPPRESGVWANELIDPVSGEKLSVLRDSATRLVTADGAVDKPGASLRLLRIETVADRFRAAHPDAPIVSLALKERASLFGGGRKPTATLWFEPSLGRFVTATAVGAFPAWAAPWGRADFVKSQPERVWNVLDARFVAHAATPDAQPGESDLGGYGTVFPHRLDAAKDPARAFRASPFADEALLALGLAAVDSLRTDAQPMLLAISLSTNDYVGHLFGPDSVEAWDELERLDAALGRFFAALDKRVGPDGWAVMLAGDHGVTTLPEAASPATRPWCARKQPDEWQRACGPATRLVPRDLVPKLEAAAVRALGAGHWVSGIADPYIYLSPAAHALDGERKEKLRRALVDALSAEPGVARVIDAHPAPLRCADGDSDDALICRSLVDGAPGDLYVLTKPGSFFDPDYVIGFGASHGTPNLYDRAVPLLVRAPGRVAAGQTIAREPVGTYARTAAGLLGVSAPAGAKRGDDLSHRR
jgi:hypothetical protein